MAIPFLHTDRWLKQHRLLATIALLLFFACAVYGFFRLRPQWSLYQDTLEEKEAVMNKLNATAWPQDPERLRAILREFNAKLGKSASKDKNGMTAETAALLEQATVLFRDRINAAYGSTDVFLEKSSQTEYKDQYDRLAGELRERDIHLSPEIFGMDEETSEPYKYQMLLKLWTTRAVTERVLAAGMAVTKTTDSRKRPASQVTALPAKEYILATGDASPYLIEIPVRVEMTGTLEQFLAFLNSLYTEDCFLPIVQMEFIAAQPPVPAPPEDGQPVEFTHRVIQIKVVCASFFLPGNAASRIPVNTQVKPMPSGA